MNILQEDKKSILSSRSVIRTSLVSPRFTNHHAADMSIFNLIASSPSTLEKYCSTPDLADYCATESASIAIYEGLHGDIQYIHKARSVRVSCVSPSTVDTKMFVGIKLGLRRARNVFTPALVGFLGTLRAMSDWFRALRREPLIWACSNT
ncbi:hypothetical protein COCMIDRAFT_29238 [Bipolaris oryzae ATCC 44560]|uniref:Uncharacterized protein n=1 Tax=Bipolaris oryzae ATCC 44560 TaxID=930090 RepID=W6Z368_COCMI|nr:uncharacterized protein COCMIDRAFT_29238 [Bipolaris oryzae ATCC 44560]EUC42109.1 hypothetical protein COCMIDRAFT_29238 [Bipolaris oryzae ATCC 44560]